MSETACYLYAIAAPVGDDVVGGLRGVADEPVRLVRYRDLAAVVGTVDVGPDGAFGEERLARNLADLAWLETAARAHHAVVAGVAGAAPVAPLRLGTIVDDDDAVRGRLDRWHDGFRSALEEVAGRAEWSVKVYAPQPVEPRPDAEPAPGAPGAGAAYLTRRKAAASARGDAFAHATAVAGQVHEELARQAADARRLAAQDQRLTGHDTPMCLNGAYLVPFDGADAFAATVEALRDRHPDCRFELAGPWPAYSFVTVEEES